MWGTRKQQGIIQTKEISEYVMKILNFYSSLSDFLIADGMAGDKVQRALSMPPLSLLFLTDMDIHLTRFCTFLSSLKAYLISGVKKKMKLQPHYHIFMCHFV